MQIIVVQFRKRSNGRDNVGIKSFSYHFDSKLILDEISSDRRGISECRTLQCQLADIYQGH